MVRFARPALWALQARAVAATTAVQTRRGAAAAAFDLLPPLPEVTSASLAKHIYYSATANWLLPGRVLLGANPTRGSVDDVARSCDAAVSLQEPHETNAVYDHAFESWTSYPLPDLEPAPSLDALDVIVQKLAARVRNGEIVYVHCAYGRGRTGLVAASLLGALYPDMGAEEALARVDAYYQTRGETDGATSPETEPQREQVRNYFVDKLNRSS